MKKELHGKKFTSDEEWKAAILEYCADEQKPFYKLNYRSEKYITIKGEYIVKEK